MPARLTELLRIDPHGALRVRGLFDSGQLEGLEGALAGLPAGRPGLRLKSVSGLEAQITPLQKIVSSMIGEDARPVRATLFDKDRRRNWALGWHQDRTIAVRDRSNADGFGQWTLKDDIHHVVPPFDILTRMLTIRIHLDPVSADNAPLLVAPGSHRLGRVAEPDIAAAVARLGQAVCLAERGDVWFYATPILHASPPAVRPRRRRVLQLLYGADELPDGLEWLGL